MPVVADDNQISEIPTPRKPKFLWLPEHIEQMTSLRAEGLNWSQVAKRMGLTKNAVIGKALRLGLLGETSYEPPPVAEPRISFPPSGHCVFPIGHPDKDGFHFCGDPVAALGLPYCPSCMARAYIPAGKKTDALKQINYAASNLGKSRAVA